jgi:hypothetical protein
MIGSVLEAIYDDYMLANFPNYESRREDLSTLGSVLDVTPTLLALLGLPVGRDMDGRVMRGIVEPTYLAEHPLEYVRSHDPWLDFGTAWLGRDSSSHEGAEALERLEQRRALGYIQ